MSPGDAYDPLALDQRLRETACGLGLDRLAIARIDGPVPPEALDAYLAAGRQAGMDYLARHRDLRLDPSRLLEGAQSVICAALSYKPVQEPSENEPARVSRYALGRDYHTVLKDKLHRLLASLTEWVPSAVGRVTVDTAPVLERYWAARAGLGWIGRNGCLIVPGLGSYVFLGEIVTNLRLPAGDPPQARCGTCRRCLEACPTGALVAPGEVDARMCISYWTVEHRGEFGPRTPRLSPWIFGCDSCQEVCPWNRLAPPTGEPAFAQCWRELPSTVDGWLTLTPERFHAHLAATPMERAGWEGLQRNARRLAEEAAREPPNREP